MATAKQHKQPDKNNALCGAIDQAKNVLLEAIRTELGEMDLQQIALCANFVSKVGKMDPELLAVGVAPTDTILTTSEFAEITKTCRERIIALKKSGVLVNGRHYLGEGAHITFPYPLAYQRMMEDKLLLGNDARLDSTNKGAKITGKKPARRTSKQQDHSSHQRINPDYRKS